MHHILKRFLLTTFFTVFASQAAALFIQPDWFDPTQPGVGTNRYSYSFNDPINNHDPSGNACVPCAYAIPPAIEGLKWLGITLGVIGAGVGTGVAIDQMTTPNSGVVVGDGMLSASVPGLGEVMGPGEDISNPGAAEPNIGRERPYGEVIEGIRGLPGAEVIGEFETPWGKGEVIELPDGTRIAARPGSKSGGPTIEVTDPDGNTEKNRFPEQDFQQESVRDTDSNRTLDRD